ncbi:iron complex transport system permease protein [Deinococcus metalli]|uniref:Iron ABC transporter permease n=1 Tax=Deinococcus metalli TaxID=1141878 RepID=A0A7W8KAG5_9DEIO|nr:iron ABC transporter permease [Deinococcus metalli]MBB5374664.1 iron complex transport system permease protein [Deinococcus metalli]GHF34619.1 iron ABC transporter permease [Deinococcus metalli]
MIPPGPPPRFTTARAVTLGGVLAAATLALAVLALGLGAVKTPAGEVVQVILGHGDALTRQLVLDLRAPRIVVAVLAGAMFAASGAMMQGVIRNPLASPDLIGVGAGAGLAATLYLLAWPGSPPGGLPWAALVGAWAGFGLVLVLAREWSGQRVNTLHPVRLALVGVAVAAALGAVQQLVLVRAPDGLGAALTFLAGSVYGADAARAARLLPWALVLLPAALLLARTLDVLNLGEDLATSLGTRVNAARLLSLTVAVALAGAAVTGAGILGFVGLLAPHVARLLVGGRHARLLPVSMLLGALLVLAADTLGRALLPPLEVPAGLFTTLVGAPYFLSLLRRSA